METITENGVVLDKTLELCHAIVSQPDFSGMQRDVETFMADDEAKELYQVAAEQSEGLQRTQREGGAASSDEMSAYEKNREALVGNDVARKFLEAQEQMHDLQKTVTKYVAKTMELGRVPVPEDFESCGEGCSCH